MASIATRRSLVQLSRVVTNRSSSNTNKTLIGASASARWNVHQSPLTLASRALASAASSPATAGAASPGPLSCGDLLKASAVENPYRDAVRYEHKNVKWTYKNVDGYANALAVGLVETGFQGGDIVLSWLPSHFAEQHILQFACSKAGLILYTLKPTVGNDDLARAQLAKALEITKANVLVSQEAGDDVHYVQMCKDVIPEIRIFDFGQGMPFITPRFPHLRLPVHTGFDIVDKEGMFPYKHLLCPSETPLAETFEASTPLMGELVMGADDMPSLGKVLTNEEVLAAPDVWQEFTKIVNKEFLEVEGVGVIF